MLHFYYPQYVVGLARRFNFCRSFSIFVMVAFLTLTACGNSDHSAEVALEDDGAATPHIAKNHARNTAVLMPDETAVYRELPDGRSLNLYVYWPKGIKPEAEAQLPAIIFFHGGGWNGGNPSQHFNHARYFADLGMVTFSAEYRHYVSDRVPPNVCLMDARSAVRYVRSHLKELRIDPGRIAIGGGSAGGHLAAATSFLTGFDHKDDDLNVGTHANALILYNPVIDNSESGYGYDRVWPYWQAFSPLHNIPANPPPTIFMLGDKDVHIPVSTGEAYKAKSEALGGRVDLKIYKDQSHGFFNHFRSMEMYEIVNRDVHEFLSDIGFVDTPPPAPAE